MYKIFINGKPLYLTDDLSSWQAVETGLLLTYQSDLDILIGIQALEEDGPILSVTLFHTDMETVWEIFKRSFVYIKAAGGLVTDGKGRYLMIYRNGKWDLPKGKLENKESPDEGALREVEEECGIGGLRIQKTLSSTYHTYQSDERKILKQTYWYLMSAGETQTLRPQRDEGIEKAEWKNEKDLSEALMNTYGSVRDLIVGLDQAK